MRRLLMTAFLILGLATTGLATAGLATAGLATVARASDVPTGPEDYVGYLGDHVITRLGADAPRAERAETFAAMMESHLALDAIARFVAGPYWKNAGAEARTRFRAAFKSLLVNRFLPAFAGQADVELNVRDSEPLGQRLWAVRVEVRQPAAGETTEIALRLLQGPEHPQVADIITQGISLGLTLREEYTAYLKRHDGDMNALIERIEARSRELAS